MVVSMPLIVTMYTTKGALLEALKISKTKPKTSGQGKLPTQKFEEVGC